MFFVKENSRVAFVRAEHKDSLSFFAVKYEKALYISEASSNFIQKCLEGIIDELKPKYVVMSVPTILHGTTSGDVEYVRRLCSNLLLTATFIEKNKILTTQEYVKKYKVYLPKDLLILPKIVKSYHDRQKLFER